MKLLNEGQVDYNKNLDIYTFSRRGDNDDVFACPGVYFRRKDDSEFVRYAVKRSPYVASATTPTT